MFKDSKAFSSFSVDDTNSVKDFYQETLGLKVEDAPMGTLRVFLGSGAEIMVYPKGPGHVPAEFTVLNFPVADIDQAVGELREKGVEFEQYDNERIKTDEHGISRSEDLNEAPHMAWFKDPCGNIMSVMQLQ